MKSGTVSVALAIAALLSTAAGCARPAQPAIVAASPHPIVGFEVLTAPVGEPTPRPERHPRFEVEVQLPTPLIAVTAPYR